MKTTTELSKPSGLKASVIGLLIFLGFVGLAKLILTLSLRDLHLEEQKPSSSDPSDIGEGFGLE